MSDIAEKEYLEGEIYLCEKEIMKLKEENKILKMINYQQKQDINVLNEIISLNSTKIKKMMYPYVMIVIQ